MAYLRFLAWLVAIASFLPSPCAGELPPGYAELEASVRQALAAAEDSSRQESRPLSAPLDPWAVARVAAAVNPEALEALNRVRKELLAVRKELGLPDMELKLEAADFNRLPAFNSAQGNMLAVSRVFPLGGKLSRRALAGFHGARRAFHEYEAILHDLLRDSRGAVAELRGGEEQSQIMDENIALSRQLAEVARARYSTGTGTQQDVQKAELEAARYQSERIGVTRMVAVARAMINQLLARPGDAALPAAGVPATPAATANAVALEATAEASRPELLAARASLDRARAELGVASSERHRPDLTGQVGYMQNPVGETDGWQAMVSINLPWFSARRKLEVEEAAAGTASEKLRLESVRNKTRFTIREALLRVQESSRSVELFRDRLIPQARQALDSTRFYYEAGQTDFLPLVDALRTLKESSLGYSRAVVDLQRRQAELDRAAGIWSSRLSGRDGAR